MLQASGSEEETDSEEEEEDYDEDRAELQEGMGASSGSIAATMISNTDQTNDSETPVNEALERMNRYRVRVFSA